MINGVISVRKWEYRSDCVSYVSTQYERAKERVLESRKGLDGPSPYGDPEQVMRANC